MGALAGRLIWAAHFLLIYGFAALACARGFADVRLLGAGVVPLIVGAATAVAILAVAAMLLLALLGPGKENAAARGGPRFLRWMTALVSGLSLVAIVWTGLPVLLLPACPSEVGCCIYHLQQLPTLGRP